MGQNKFEDLYKKEESSRFETMEANYKLRLIALILNGLGVVLIFIGAFLSKPVSATGGIMFGIGMLLWGYDFSRVHRQESKALELAEAAEEQATRQLLSPQVDQVDKDQWQKELDTLELERRHPIC